MTRKTIRASVMPIINDINQKEDQIASNITNIPMIVGNAILLFLEGDRNLKLVKSARIVTARAAMWGCKLAGHVTLRHAAALCIQFKFAEDATTEVTCPNPTIS
jgi:hypothetical protein